MGCVGRFENKFLTFLRATYPVSRYYKLMSEGRYPETPTLYTATPVNGYDIKSPCCSELHLCWKVVFYIIPCDRPSAASAHTVIVRKFRPPRARKLRSSQWHVHKCSGIQQRPAENDLVPCKKKKIQTNKTSTFRTT